MTEIQEKINVLMSPLHRQDSKKNESSLIACYWYLNKKIMRLKRRFALKTAAINNL